MPTSELQIVSVSGLNHFIKGLMDSEPILSQVAVLGEISNYKLYPSGHHYFSLKDEQSQIRCVLFRGNALSVKVPLTNGKQIVVIGNVTCFERDGTYQLYVRSVIDPEADAGSWQKAFEKIYKKLEKEGLFDRDRKKPLPPYPGKIAVITSPAGAAVRDVLRILNNRWPMAEVVVVPARVQGEEAPGELTEAVRTVNEKKLADLIILGRGGGSVEDLWAFNSEELARAIYASRIPVITGIGHEPDRTIADYVADKCAATPSNAAELAVPDQEELRRQLLNYKRKLDVSQYIADLRQRMDQLSDTFGLSMEHFLSKKRSDLALMCASLEALSPLKVLERGYTIAEKEGKAVSSSRELAEGDRLLLKFYDGGAICTVDEVKNEL